MRINNHKGTVPPVPGLQVYDGNIPGTVNLVGSVDALEAAGAPAPKNKQPLTGAIPIEGVDLRDFQSIGILQIIRILREHGGAILGDEMGLGKTVQGAVIGETLRGDYKGLVVCPAAVRHQWEAWLNKVTQMTDDIANLGPPSDKKYHLEWEAWNAGYSNWGIVSYNKMADALKAVKPRVIIFDEPHNYLQGRGNTYVKTLWKYGAQIQYKLALTGTPYLAHPAGLWQILNVLLGLRFGKAHDFDIRYCNGHQGQWGWMNKGATNTPELATRLKHYMVRRMKADVAKELPKVTRTVRWVEGSKHEQKAATAALLKLDHSVNGLRTALDSTLEAKYAPIVDFIEETNRPTVVFCWRRADAERMQVALEEAGQRAMVIHGEWDAQTRADMVANAIKEKCHVTTTFGASATGLDGLQYLSSDLVFHAIDPVVATLLQAISRLERIGQTQPVSATFFAMMNSVDDILVDKVVNRIEVYESILGHAKSSTALRDALLKGGLGDISDDKVLQAVFGDLFQPRSQEVAP